MITTVTRLEMHRKTLEASITLLRGYATEADIDLQVYEALPTTFHPPTAFPEGARERRLYSGIHIRERTVTVLIRVLWRIFAEGERAHATWQKADFIDGFSDYVESRFHAIADNTAVALVSTDDDPEYVIRGARGDVAYFSTLFGLEGATQN